MRQAIKADARIDSASHLAVALEFADRIDGTGAIAVGDMRVGELAKATRLCSETVTRAIKHLRERGVLRLLSDARADGAPEGGRAPARYAFDPALLKCLEVRDPGKVEGHPPENPGATPPESRVISAAHIRNLESEEQKEETAPSPAAPASLASSTCHGEAGQERNVEPTLTADSPVPFGKYKGSLLRDLDNGYITYIVETRKAEPCWIAAFRAELQRRDAENERGDATLRDERELAIERTKALLLCLTVDQRRHLHGAGLTDVDIARARRAGLTYTDIVHQHQQRGAA
jgi:hypothetical protein